MEEKHFGPVWFIPGKNSGKYPYCHSVYIEGAGVLIDPASDKERLIELRKKSGVKEVWLSHWHEDHFMHLDLFDDLPLRIMEQDSLPLSGLEILMDSYGVDEEYREFWRPLYHDLFNFRPRKPAGFLNDGEVMDLGAVTVEVINTPGHTPGHLALFFQEVDLLYMADYDLSNFGPWYGDVGSSIEETIVSVKQLQNIPAKIWITSHEQGIFKEEPGELWDRYIGVIRLREQKLLNLLQKPRAFQEIVEACIIYGKPRKPVYFFEFGEKAHMRKHLEKLIHDGTVSMEGGRYFLSL
jgi:glyoxylase-like metal-dependent hydrolase (beta-lactamase superfamily II)